MSSPLGLSTAVNRIEEYDTRWAELYGAEAVLIERSLGPLAVAIEHVGSTSVPGLPAKPILDIAVAVSRLDQYAECIEPLRLLGYEHAYWAGVQNDHVFGKGVDRTHLLHVVQYDGDQWRNYLRFRDALRADESLRRIYATLKQDLVHAHPTSRADYTAGKATFIASVLKGL